jgi:hypothetical protein
MPLEKRAESKQTRTVPWVYLAVPGARIGYLSKVGEERGNKRRLEGRFRKLANTP